MKDEKYVQNQKNFIKRELANILRQHAAVSCILLILLIVLVLLAVSYEHPDSWQEVTITLEKYQTVNAGRGSRLDIYDTNGNRYSFNRNEGNIKQQLVAGRDYTFIYSDNFFHDIVEVIEIDNVVYLDHNSATSNYWGMVAMFGGLAGLFMIALIVVNVLYYRTLTSDRVKRIRKYKKRICDREQKM